MVELECGIDAAVRGVVTPVAWGDDNSIVSLAICTDDDDEFLVDTSSGGGTALFGCLRALVRVSGRLFEGDNHRPTLEVERYRVLFE